jgi:hypothetical protein
MAWHMCACGLAHLGSDRQMTQSPELLPSSLPACSPGRGKEGRGEEERRGGEEGVGDGRVGEEGGRRGGEGRDAGRGQGDVSNVRIDYVCVTSTEYHSTV